ncbi:methyltransferase domain-containing protein [Abditibacterium utsteinense]|nr:methyltransferase domain-containing protein [Abditibacterium utsteinense]
MKSRFFVPLCLSVAVFAAIALPKLGHKPSAPLAKPDGTMRQTASPWTGAADEFDTPGRDAKLQLPRVFHDLKIGQGSKVADIGAGGGWLTVRLGFQVGPKGVVYAEEILPKYTAYIEKRARLSGLSNVRTVLGTVTDPKLPAKTIDAAIILNAYHEFDQPLAVLAKVRAGLKSGGRLGIMERDDDGLRLEARRAYAQTGRILRRVTEKNDGNALTDDHRLALDVVRREGERAGFKFVSSRELGDDNYLAVFAAP